MRLHMWTMQICSSIHATLGYALAYVDYADLFEYTCNSWLCACICGLCRFVR